ncbi:girdin-like [Periplaneta americana]|uniref:girdin-like n=1 Tax=Periplaneta americana TaxID=6978 RepID=UPI0037E86845
MEFSDFKLNLENWTRHLCTTPHEKRSELLKKLNGSRKRVVWERILKHVRPAVEVEHVRKNLSLKNVEEKLQLRKTLEAKEKEMCIKDQDFEQVHKNLSLLNCKQQHTKQRTSELHLKNLLLLCKEQDLTKKAELYEELCQLGHEFDQPPTRNGTARTEAYQNLIVECEGQLEEFHKLYRTEDTDKQMLYNKRESVASLLRHEMKNLYATDIWHAVLHRMDMVNADTRILAQNCLRRKPEHLQVLKDRISTEIKAVRSHSQLGLCFANHRHQQKKEDDDIILSQKIEKLQEIVSKSTGDTLLEQEEIRHWLELQMKCAELNVIKEALQLEVKNTTGKPPQFDLLTLQDKNTEECRKQIEMLKEYIQVNLTWLMASYANTVRAHDTLKKEISTYKVDVTSLDVIKDLLQQELKVFAELPLHVLHKTLLPSHVLSSNQQLLQYHHHIGHEIDTLGLTDVLSVLEAGTSTCPQGIVLRLIEKQLFLVFLKTMQFDVNWSSTLVPLDISSVRSTENGVLTSVTETVGMLEKSLESCRLIAEKAEDSLKTWIEHPMQCAVPSSLQHDGKNFQQWKQEFDAALKILSELEDQQL